MHNLKFLTLLRTLDEQEISSFHKYLKRLHTNEQVPLSLFAYILKFYPGFGDERKLDIEYAYRKVFKKEIDGDRKKILNALSDLHRWLKNFMLTEKATGTALESQALWLAILRERGLQAEFSKQFTRLQNEIDALPKRSTSDYLKGMVSSHFMCYYVTTDNLDEDNDAVQQYEDSLDLFYIITKFKIACEKANRLNVLSIPMEPEASLAHVDFSGMHVYEQHSLLLLYREIYQLVARHNEASYARIEAMLPENAGKAAPDELQRIMSYLYNYASSQIRNGREEFWDKMHWLNKFGVEHAIFLHEGSMSVTKFNNIVSIACNMNDVEWASFFIRSQSRFLPEHLRADAVLLADATVFFEKRAYDEILKMLEGKDFKDLLDNIRAKALILKSQYETGDREGRLWDLCSVFEAFLGRQDRKKIGAVTASINFTRILKLLTRKNAYKDKIINDIETKQPLYFKSWLLKKAKDYTRLA